MIEIAAPASKSMTQRALMMAALSPGTTTIVEPLVCDDSRYLTDLLRALGCRVTWGEGGTVVVSAPLRSPREPVFCGNAGTTMRFGACLSLVSEGPLALDGDAHMRKRPIGALGDALAALGVTVSYLATAGCPPLSLARTGPTPNRVAVDTSVSSQYASGLLMIAPRLPRGLEVELDGELVSAPYVRMTVTMLERAGVEVAWLDSHRIAVAGGGYPPIERIEVEADWSGAAFLIAARHLTGVDLAVPYLLDPSTSLQGDAAFTSMVEAISGGAAELDLTDVPDLIAPLAAICLFAPQPVRLRGAAHTRVKECDRVAVLARELGKLGAAVTARHDGLDLRPLDSVPAGRWLLHTEDDHRMAMTFGVLSLRIPGIDVDNPGCVSKSFPNFWSELERIRDHLREVRDDRAR